MVSRIELLIYITVAACAWNYGWPNRSKSNLTSTPSRNLEERFGRFEAKPIRRPLEESRIVEVNESIESKLVGPNREVKPETNQHEHVENFVKLLEWTTNAWSQASKQFPRSSQVVNILLNFILSQAIFFVVHIFFETSEMFKTHVQVECQ